MVDILIRDKLRLSVEAASGGKQTVVYTAKGQPSFMTIIPQFDMSAYGASVGLTGAHRAFRAGWAGTHSEIMLGTYLGSIKQGELISQPYTDPRAAGSINILQQIAAARACGDGFHIMSRLEWDAANVYGLTQGGLSLGNQQRGSDIKGNTGKRIPGAADYTYTGSGGAAWTNDGTPTGLHDMTGNVWEHLIGVRNCFGELQVSVNSNMSHSWTDNLYADASIGSWAAIDGVTGELITPQWSGTISDGTYVPTTPRSIKLSGILGDTSDYTLGHSAWQPFVLNQYSLGGENKISNAGVTTLREYGLYPIAGVTESNNTVLITPNGTGWQGTRDIYAAMAGGTVTDGVSAGPNMHALAHQVGVAGDIYACRPCYQPNWAAESIV